MTPRGNVISLIREDAGWSTGQPTCLVFGRTVVSRVSRKVYKVVLKYVIQPVVMIGRPQTAQAEMSMPMLIVLYYQILSQSRPERA